MRKHYMTLCFRGEDVVITHIVKGNTIEVTFEQAISGDFNTLVVSIDGSIISNSGFNKSDVDYYLRFLNMNRSGIIAESKGEI